MEKIMRNSKISNDILPLVSKEWKLLKLNEISRRKHSLLMGEIKTMREEFNEYFNNEFNITDALLTIHIGEDEGMVLYNFYKSSPSESYMNNFI